MKNSSNNKNEGELFSQNPFVVESPEKLLPQQIVDLFVEEYTSIDIIKQRKHTFIWGSRGSGKSMMLRYLEPQCQAITHGSIENFLNEPEPFLSIYCPCKQGYFNKTDMLLLDRYTLMIITEHMLNLYIASQLIECLRNQFPKSFFHNNETKKFVEGVLSLFDRASIASSVEEVNSVLKVEDDRLGWLQTLLTIENRKIHTFLRRNVLQGGKAIYDGATSGYHDFLLPLMKTVSSMSKLKSLPIYVMLDDADKLTREQQLNINTWVANRDQKFVCFKVASEFEGYKTFKRVDDLFGTIEEGDLNLYIEREGLIEAPHDYSEVNINELYTHSKTDYTKKVRLIANRRLELAGFEVKEIEEFLPMDSTEARLLEEIKKETAKEWEAMGEPGDRDDYVYRYATARLFQRLREAKKRKSYAGFMNMVHLSSGVVRAFLEPCYLMFSRCVSKQTDPRSIQFIPAEIQDDVLFKYSEEFLIFDLEKIRKDLPPEKWTVLEALSILLESLGRLLYERLHDPEAREARLFSFTVRGRIPSNIDEVLRLGVRYRYFQLRTYSTKEGGGREKWYILNRRLCPVFKLDPTGFEGRISLTPDHLKLACENPEKFIRLRLRKPEKGPQLDLFSLVAEGEEK